MKKDEEKDYKGFTKRDLMLKIMSEVDGWMDRENELKKMKKDDLISILL